MPKFEMRDMEVSEATLQFLSAFHINYVVDLVEMFIIFVFYIRNQEKQSKYLGIFDWVIYVKTKYYKIWKAGILS